MPAFGLGTWGNAPEDAKMVKDAVTAAIEAGYRHIDCAYVYGNESTIGEVFGSLPASVKREDLFITSKLWNTCHRPENVKKQLKHTLKSLNLDYLDNFIIHWPVSFVFEGLETLTPKDEDGNARLDEVKIEDTWKALEECVDEGLVRGIGLSNFNIRRIQEVLDIARIKPVNLQVELHPYLPQDELLKFCRDNEIAVTAYSPLGTDREPKLMQDPVVVEVAKRHNTHPAHILISYHLNKGTAVIPKSSQPKRVVENMRNILELTAEDMADLAKLKSKNVRYVCPVRMWKSNVFDE